MEEVLDPQNLNRAYCRILSNRGARTPDVDGMTVAQLKAYVFVRYADDCNIYVRSHKAAERTLASVTRFVERKLRLRVNREKSAVDRP